MIRPAIANSADQWAGRWEPIEEPTHRLLNERSDITFSASAGGQTVVGKFSDVDARIRFDPNTLQDNAVRITVGLSPDTIHSQTPGLVSEVTGSKWLDVAHYPKAVLKARDFERVLPNTYQGYGRLTLLGQTVPVSFRWMMTPGDGDDVMVANATMQIDRSDFDIGRGAETADNVRDAIVIRANMAVQPTDP